MYPGRYAKVRDGHRSPSQERLNTQPIIHRCMSSKTISLERSAYDKLRAAKRPKESFSDVVSRVLEPNRPSLTALAGFLTPDEGKAVRDTIQEMRIQDDQLQKERLDRWRRPHGRRRGQ
ncbi:MAG: antitoxin VapB family protein [Thermoplasmata archaeon]